MPGKPSFKKFALVTLLALTGTFVAAGPSAANTEPAAAVVVTAASATTGPSDTFTWGP
ncbi:hypothetical protein ACFVX6_27065 [Streptomyces sp. NPDC058289]|uniref:hypothetical protein n=1 Tax=Streptomyces sp. NPDC058289 TaxID=3346425 RepID=UPI0036E7991B